MYPNQQPWPGHQQAQDPNSVQPPNGNYPPVPPNQGSASTATTLPPLTGMASTYRLPAPQQHHDMMYRPVTDPYGRPAPPQMPYVAHPAPAPRQRTAIACRYCRRRKIRCSGFENSEDGRCQNCTRFSQECIFTPVSAQTQAFVPAHTVYRQGQGPPTQLYGAYGQPLPTSQAPDPYARAPQAYPNTPYPPQGYRPNEDPHGPSLPPPNPAASRPERYAYPDPTTLAPAGAVSPASSSASYQSSSYPQPNAPPQPYYVNPPSSAAHTQQAHQHGGERHRPSPTNSTHNFDHSRASSSPHNQPQPGTPYGSDGAGLRPPSNMPARSEGRTPPPQVKVEGQGSQQGGNGSGPRPGMSISSIVTGQNNSGQGSNDGSSPGTRSAADSDMLNRLRG